jgi:RHS repeat-associated protein
MRKGLEEAEQMENAQVTVHFFHCDHLGTPIALTDREGKIAWAAKLDPWGNIAEEYNPDNIEQPLRLPGQYHDRETDLYYNRFRYYDPKIGSYISQDPIGLAGGLNLSKYSDSPLHEVDPHGLQAAPPTTTTGSNQQTCLYNQSTGELACFAKGKQTIDHKGYSGKGEGKNNPDKQGVQGTGPIPRGEYTVGPAVNHITATAHRLTPNPLNNMEGRSAFLVHGDNASHTASEGCIIMPPNVRGQLHEGDTIYVVEKWKSN